MTDYNKELKKLNAMPMGSIIIFHHWNGYDVALEKDCNYKGVERWYTFDRHKYFYKKHIIQYGYTLPYKNHLSI